MKLQHAHQEVLIFKNTTLSQKVLCRNNSSNKDNAAGENLEEAVWDGLLNELVPEIMPSIRNEKMVIWGVVAGEFYLLIDLANSPELPEPIFTIEPNMLLALKNMS